MRWFVLVWYSIACFRIAGDARSTRRQGAETQTPVSCLTGVWNWYGVVLGLLETSEHTQQNGPDKCDDGKNRQHIEPQSKVHVVSLPLNSRESSKEGRATEAPNILQCENEANKLARNLQ